jgi:hypothetical protein
MYRVADKRNPPNSFKKNILNYFTEWQKKDSIMELLKVDTEVSITLKDLTDLIGVQHSKAMEKVLKLSQESSFGEVSKIDTFNLNGVKVETLLLNKKQAIATGAKLNNALLMKVIDKMEELQKQIQQPKILTVPEQIALLAQGNQLIEHKVEEIKIELDELKNDIVLTPSQKRILQKSVATKVYSFNAPIESNKKLFAKVYSKLKDSFAVSSYMEIPRLKFNEAKSMVENITLIDLV